jgi:hypothetical protein
VGSGHRNIGTEVNCGAIGTEYLSGIAGRVFRPPRNNGPLNSAQFRSGGMESPEIDFRTPLILTMLHAFLPRGLRPVGVSFLLGLCVALHCVLFVESKTNSYKKKQWRPASKKNSHSYNQFQDYLNIGCAAKYSFTSALIFRGWRMVSRMVAKFI